MSSSLTKFCFLVSFAFDFRFLARLVLLECAITRVLESCCHCKVVLVGVPSTLVPFAHRFDERFLYE